MQTTRIVRRAALPSLTGLSMSTLYRLIAQGTFPRPVSLSTQAVGWPIESIEGWIQTRKEATQ